MNHVRFMRDEPGERLLAELSVGNLDYAIAVDATEPTMTANLAEIIEKYSVDHGVIAIGKKGDSAFFVETTSISIAYRGTPYQGAIGTTRRDSPLSVYREASGESGHPICYVLTPYKGCALDDVTIYWFDNGHTTVDGARLACPIAAITPEFLKHWMPIEIVGPSEIVAGASAAYEIVAPDGATVYLESTAGVLDRTRAVNGDTVNLTTLAETSAGPAKIKAGYKYWPGKADKTISINVA